jgi:hypothetical protein
MRGLAALLTSTDWLVLGIDVEKASTLAYPVKMLWQGRAKGKKNMSFTFRDGMRTSLAAEEDVLVVRGSATTEIRSP